MDKQIEVMKKAVELSKTGFEGLEHIYNKTLEGQFEETAILFKDVFHAFTEIDKAIKPIIPELSKNEIEPLTVSLIEGFKIMLATYEKEENMRPLEIIQYTLMPRYKKWQAKLERILLNICHPN